MEVVLFAWFLLKFSKLLNAESDVYGEIFTCTTGLTWHLIPWSEILHILEFTDIFWRWHFFPVSHRLCGILYLSLKLKSRYTNLYSLNLLVQRLYEGIWIQNTVDSAVAISEPKSTPCWEPIISWLISVSKHMNLKGKGNENSMTLMFSRNVDALHQYI